MKQNEHGRLIAAAAKEHLRPLGCTRKGRSRSWRSDQGFWLIGIEFQPSGFSRGTYLNVGVCWLWSVKSYFSYDAGYDRLGQFVGFESTEQFAPAVDQMARQAAARVKRLREQFHSMTMIAEALDERAQTSRCWPLFHAAIATGLSGRMAIARGMFERLAREPTEYLWQDQRKHAALELASNLTSPAQFGSAVLDRVHETRTLQRLTPLDREQDQDAFARLLFS